MKSTRLVQLGLALTGLTLCGQALAKDYIVKFKTPQATLAAATLESEPASGGIVRDAHLAGNLVKISLGGTTESLVDEAKAVAALMARPDVEYVTEDFKVKMLDHADSAYSMLDATADISKQWSLSKINAPSAWQHGVGSRQVTVAVIDTGADSNHVDLKDNLVKGYNFIDNNDDTTDVVQAGANPGHGTHCAGIIGAAGVEGGTVGINQQVSVMPLRFIGPSGQGDLLAAIKAIDYAIEKKVDVVSASWGAAVPEAQAKPLIDAIGRLNSAGIIFVAAAGNDGANNDSTSMYPVNADFPNVIAVAASDTGDGKPLWSNYGRAKVSIASPGLDIYSTLPDNQYGKLSGTSMATPLVAGLVGLLKSQVAGERSQGLSGPQVRALLQATGAKTQIETACNCRIDAGAAADALASNKLILIPTAQTFAVGANGKFTAFGGNGSYKYASANPAILDVKADGTLSAKTAGDAVVTVTDGSGATAQSVALHVGTSPSGGSSCPLDPGVCQIICAINPSAPWCTAQAPTPAPTPAH